MSDVEKMDDIDGLTNIHYSNLTIQRRKLFTQISVSVNQTLYLGVSNASISLI